MVWAEARFLQETSPYWKTGVWKSDFDLWHARHRRPNAAADETRHFLNFVCCHLAKFSMSSGFLLEVVSQQTYLVPVPPELATVPSAISVKQ